MIKEKPIPSIGDLHWVQIDDTLFVLMNLRTVVNSIKHHLKSKPIELGRNNRGFSILMLSSLRENIRKGST